jgi:hypothetical protein
MDKLITKPIIAILICFFAIALNGQNLSDKDAIEKSLSGEDISGRFRWRPKDRELKRLAKEIIIDREKEIANDGISLITFILTGDEYDDENDSFFLNTLIDFVDVQTLIYECAFVRSHFKKSLYSNESKEKLGTLADSKEILKWQVWTPYYLSFLEIEGMDSTLLFIKENIDAINHLHFALYNDSFRFDTIDINVCLAMLGKLSDTIVVQQIDEKFNANWRKDYREYFERLSRIRTPLAFQKIGAFLVSDLNNIKSKEHQKYVRQMALAVFLVYVENFPDRSTKIQETINMWNFVEFSNMQGKDYSTNEYMDMAKNWYIVNKNNLVLDNDKY